MTRILLTTLIVAATAAAASAAPFEIDPVHSTVGFKVKHMMVANVRGGFGDFAGTFTWDPQDLAATRVEATIQAASIDTGNEKRDEHLRSGDFFDVANHPTITFVSTGIEPRGQDRYSLHGDLTLHGVTRPVTLDVEATGTLAQPDGGRRVGFEARGEIDRREFGLNWSKALDNGGVVVGDAVTLELAIAGVEAK